MSLYDYILDILTDCFIRKKEPNNPKKFIFFDKLYCNYCNQKVHLRKDKRIIFEKKSFCNNSCLNDFIIKN